MIMNFLCPCMPSFINEQYIIGELLFGFTCTEINLRCLRTALHSWLKIQLYEFKYVTSNTTINLHHIPSGYFMHDF